jgi:hypothetical protein
VALSAEAEFTKRATVTYGSQKMTFLDSVETTRRASRTDEADNSVQLFYLRDPTPGSNSIIVKYPASSRATAMAVSLYGVQDLGARFKSAHNATREIRTAVQTTVAGSWILDEASYGNGSPIYPTNGSQTLLERASWGTQTGALSMLACPTPKNDEMGWRAGNEHRFAHLAVVLTPLQSSGPQMAIGFDNATTQTAMQKKTVSFTHTTGTALQRILLVGTSTENGSADSVVSVSYGANPLQRLSAIQTPLEQDDAMNMAQLWYLLNPPSGVHKVGVNFANDSGSHIVGAVSLFGVEQRPPQALVGNEYAWASGSSITATITRPGSWIADVVSYGNHSQLTPTQENQVVRYSVVDGDDASPARQVTGSSAFSSCYVSEPGMRSVGWRMSPGYRRVAHVGVVLKPALASQGRKVSSVAYVGNAVYEDSRGQGYELAYTSLEGLGKVLYDPAAGVDGAPVKKDIRYYITDHLGSTRMQYSETDRNFSDATLY